MSFITELQEKQLLLRADYEKLLMDNNVDRNNFDLKCEDDKVDFATMSRWHVNSHITQSEWLRSFNKISGRLDVREEMTCPGDIFVDFVRYFIIINFSSINALFAVRNSKVA